MQRWDRVEAFVEVVRLGAFKAAAERLKVSSSHVSRLVSQLENQLGTTLLYRTTRRIRLTEAGRLYYQHCQHLVEGFRDAEAAVKDLQAKPTGLLSLTCATTFGERYLAPLVHDFMCRHPRLEVRMHFTNRQVDIIDEGFDIAIRMGTLKDSSLIARRLCELESTGLLSFVTNTPGDLAPSPELLEAAALEHDGYEGFDPAWSSRWDIVVTEHRLIRIAGRAR